MSLQPQWFSILRERRTGDGAGGKIVVLYSQRQRYRGTLNRKKTMSSDMRLEEAAHNLQGPGVETATKRVVCFRQPFPALEHDAVLVAEDGTQYTVQTIRPYDWTLQADVEIVE